MKYNDSNLSLTHIWVEGFGWENTIFVPSDFIEILKLPRQLSKCSIFYCFNYNADRTEIVARKFKGNEKHRNNKLAQS